MVGAETKSGCPYKMTVQNVYNINNHGTMYFPGAAQGLQCGDYNSMYASLLPDRNDRRDTEYREDGNSAGDTAYEHIADSQSDIEVVHL